MAWPSMILLWLFIVLERCQHSTVPNISREIEHLQLRIVGGGGVGGVFDRKDEKKKYLLFTH